VRMDPALFDSTGILSQGRDCLASMGIYLFNRDLLVDMLTTTDYEDFGRQIFPQAINTHHAQVHLFDGYWEDIGTIKAFYDASLSLVRHAPPFDLSWSQAPVYTRARFLPPSRVHGATVNHSLISDGCQIGDGCLIENSIIGLRCLIEPGVTIRNSIVMGADFYERRIDPNQPDRADRPPVGIGAGTLIEGAIVDKNCRIGRHVRIANSAGVVNSPADSELCVIRDGIPVVLKDAVLQDRWELGTGTA
jgi:glucose-1-phosphate adenylyltransferase